MRRSIAVVLLLGLAACGGGDDDDDTTGGDGGATADGATSSSSNRAMGTVGTTSINISGSGVAQLIQGGTRLRVGMTSSTIACGATAIPPLEQFLDLNLLVSSGTIEAGKTYDGTGGVLEAYVRSYGAACGGA